MYADFEIFPPPTIIRDQLIAVHCTLSYG